MQGDSPYTNFSMCTGSVSEFLMSAMSIESEFSHTSMLLGSISLPVQSIVPTYIPRPRWEVELGSFTLRERIDGDCIVIIYHRLSSHHTTHLKVLKSQTTMDEMDDYYRNKISLSPKYIEWTTLPDKSEMFYCKKNYRKPVDEIKLLAHIKRTIVTNDRATQKRKKQKSESLTYDELLEKVRNNDVYKEFMKLEHGKTKFYDCKNYVSGNAGDLKKLMNRISNRMNCNKRRTSALGDSVDVEIEKRGAVVTYSVGVNVEIEKRDTAVALLSFDKDNARGGMRLHPDTTLSSRRGVRRQRRRTGGGAISTVRGIEMPLWRC